MVDFVDQNVASLVLSALPDFPLELEADKARQFVAAWQQRAELEPQSYTVRQEQRELRARAPTRHRHADHVHRRRDRLDDAFRHFRRVRDLRRRAADRLLDDPDGPFCLPLQSPD